MSKKQELVEVKPQALAEQRENSLLIEDLMSSGALPQWITKKEDAFIITQQGKELGVDPVTALNNIYLVKGKIMVSSILVNGLLQRNGIFTEVIEDCVKIPRKVKDPKSGEVREVADWRTKLRMYRNVPGLGVINQEFEFKYSDAEAAGLTGNATWTKWRKYMLYWRCLSGLADRMAADVLMGANLPTKFYEGIDINDKGEVTINIPHENNEIEKVEHFETIEVEAELSE